MLSLYNPAAALLLRCAPGRTPPKGLCSSFYALGVSLAAYTAVARKVDTGAAWMMVPYLAWVGFASVLNEEIVRLNPR